ncbi:glycosyltransferase [Leucobacter tardus]|uniref:Glycosyltransferase family 1 protein n=1 Tax=Leucobacter tardus TaxID=501483 RepID=A0A939QCC1_9MICO|nr:glycosyltransferase [Leucobacter tardus]MBO2989182.1 glycosyltransferase family 1 protein [Leucobacter tardus]
MSTFLLAATPIRGHFGPILEIAVYLHGRGHDVTLLSGRRYRDTVEGRGVRFVPLRGVADFDDRDADSYIPDRLRYRGIRRAQYEIRTIFFETVPDQYAALSEQIAAVRPDAVLVDNTFAGALPFTRAARFDQSADATHPVIAGLGVMPLSQSDDGLAPHGMGLPPARTALDRLRYRLFAVAAKHAVFRSVQRAAARVLAQTGMRLDQSAMDLARLFDVFFQSGPRGLDYPRPELSRNVRYAGVLPQAPAAADLPDWWDDLDGRRVVHVTQGTIDNDDFGRLVRPTIDALADTDLLVVVSAGGNALSQIGPLPANARAATYLPYDLLLPRTDVMVTNGGFGGVLAAVSHGVPLVVAGVTEDKPEVAARVAWSGAGIDLRDGSPDAVTVRDAVTRVLDDPSYRDAARRLAEECASRDALEQIEHELQVRVAARA